MALSTKKERFRAIRGFGGAYYISDCGAVYSHKSNKLLTPSKNSREVIR